MENTTTRKRRTTITVETIKRIRHYLDLGEKIKRISTLLCLSYNSTLVIANQLLAGLSDSEIIHKKGRSKKDQSIVAEVTAEIILRNNSLTQKGIKEELSLSGYNLSQPAVARLPENMKYSRKRLSLVPPERNSTRNLDARQSYARYIEHISLFRFVYLDETGFNIHTSQSFGYSPVNSRLF
jgi:hypothetical protein